MNRSAAILVLVAAVTIAAPAPQASAAPNHWPVRRGWYYDWNKNYANTTYGQPVSLVVPPTANLQTNYGWGVSSSRLERVDHQFMRNYPGDGSFGSGGYHTTPIWPSDTTQFGVYSVRAPW
jgi:hypothetical protein